MSLFRVITYDQCSSTNSLLAKNHTKYRPGTVIRCLKQTKGKGRWGRDWYSSTKDGLYFSIYFEYDKQIQGLYYSFITCLSVIEYLRNMNLKAMFLWPNDILCNNKKICGVLGKGIFKVNRKIIIVGVGLNVNHEKNSFPPSINKSAISMRMISNKVFRISEVFSKLLLNLEKLMLKNLKFKDIMKKLELYSYLKKNDKIKIVTPEKQELLNFIGYGDSGEIKAKNGKHEKSFFVGDVSRIKK